MLEKASVSDLELLLTSWQNSAQAYGDEGIVFASDIETKIQVLKKNISEPNSFAYLFKDEQKEIRALLSIIHAGTNCKVSWLKMLDLDIHPDFALGEIPIKEAANAIFSSIFEPISLLFDEHKEAKELKIYGRTDGMHELFSKMVKDKTLQETLAKADILCSRNGSWLVFRKIS